MDELNISSGDEEIIKSIMDSHGYTELKKTQVESFNNNALTEGNYLLVAQTGNGKTLCAECKTKKILDSGGSVGYLVPSRQLVRSKKEAINEWADDYAVRSGREKYRSGDVAVATYRSFYEAILQNKGNARSFDLIVLDDFHEIYGSFVGPEIEKVISAALEENIEIFGMSATIGNPEEISSWMNAECLVSSEGRQIEIEELMHKQLESGSKKDSIVSVLQQNKNKGPFLVFNYARSWAETRAKKVSEEGIFSGQNNTNYKSKLKEKLNGEVTSKMEKLGEMINNGVAYHHAGLPRNIKYWIEDLYNQGVIKCIFSTTTIAYGFDSPVKTVVVADFRRGSEWIGVYEYIQWIGRAARPGYGYDKGYAISVTKDPDYVRNQYFEENRELEPVSTHFETDPQFRKLCLELIDNGWNDPSQLEDFVESTLYWERLNTEGAWGRSFRDRNTIIKERLRNETLRLEKSGFINESRTNNQFETTRFGSGTIDFLFETLNSYSLKDVLEFKRFITSNKITPFTLVYSVVDNFNQTIGYTKSKTLNDELISKIDSRQSKYGITDETVTTSLLNWYWCNNIPLDQIEDRTDIDCTYLPSLASTVAETIRATKHLFRVIEGVDEPLWLDKLADRLSYGVKDDAVELVSTVSNLGRYRARNLRSYINNPGITPGNVDKDASLIEKLKILHKEVNDDDQFKDILRSVDGIGSKTSANIFNFIIDHEGNSSEKTNVGEINNDETIETPSLDEWT